MAAPRVDAEYLKEIEKARRDLRALMSRERCANVMLCLAWHHAGTYNANTKTGGPNGSIGNMEELKQGENAGLATAINLCEEVKAKHPKITYADLFQLAGVVAVEASGGPSIDFVPGRKDSLQSPEEVHLPDATQGAQNLRGAFYRMGLSDKDIVALFGSKILGKANNERSGFETLRWSREPFKFNNSYFVELMEGYSKGLLTLPTEKALVEDPKFRHYVALYAKNEDAFFTDYAESHKKLSELGFTPPPLALEYVESHKKLPELGFTPPPLALEYVESHKKLPKLGFTPPPFALEGAAKSINILKQSVVGVVVAIVLVIFVYFYEIFSQKNQVNKA